MGHRGPDDYGMLIDKNIAIGHTRLSIIDLTSNGHQPMLSQCRRYAIIYNGEVYNFREIKDKLEAKGYSFYSSTDTEVVLNGYIEYKEKIAQKLNGMFAFSIYDFAKKQIFLARDRSGIKPLYYYEKGLGFMFSSEIKSIKENSHPIDYDAKILFLLLGYVPEPYTIYKGIKMFPAGCYGFHINGKFKFFQFSAYSHERKNRKPYGEVVCDVRELLSDAIERHLISDAPIGVFLSGGLDSSAITAFAAQHKPNLQTVSLTFAEQDLNEEYYQNIIVSKYRTMHAQLSINDNTFAGAVEAFLECIEQPTIDGFNTFLVSKAAKLNGLNTVLSGIGADEIFYGYPSFRVGSALKWLSNVPYPIIKLLIRMSRQPKMELLQLENDLCFYLPKRALFSPSEIASIMRVGEESIYRLITDLWESCQSQPIGRVEDKISYYELTMYMRGQLLRDADVFGMANSLEIRVPFLDTVLVDYVLSIGQKLKFGEFNKQILVDVSKDILPKEIFDRKKMGFVLPLEKWLKRNSSAFEVEGSIYNNLKDNNFHWAKLWAGIVIGKF